MRRREFLGVLGSTAAVWPRTARAQQSTMRVVGFLYPGTPELSTGIISAFRKGLGETGFIEGRNVAVDFRFAYNDNTRLAELAADLVRSRVAVIAAPGSTPSALAAKAATTTIPIVFGIGPDPIELGLVATLNRPGGNITGISSLNAELGAKRLGVLRELLPNGTRFGLLVNPANRNAQSLTRDTQEAGAAIGRQIENLNASSARDIEAAFASMAKKGVEGLLVGPDPLLDSRRVQLITLAAHQRLPTIYPFRESVEIGGLMSYGSSAAERDRQVGVYTGRILKGESPAELPVMRATKFEFVINRQTGRALGLEIPATLLAQADELIE